MARNIFFALLTLLLWPGPAATIAQPYPLAASFSEFAVLAQAGGAGNDVSTRAVETVRSIQEEGLSTETVLTWIILGALVGDLVGSIFTLRRRGFGIVLNLLIGGVGAFLGGLTVRETGLDFGWPRVSFSTETVLMAAVFSILLVLAYRVIGNKVHRRLSPPAKTEEKKARVGIREI